MTGFQNYAQSPKPTHSNADTTLIVSGDSLKVKKDKGDISTTIKYSAVDSIPMDIPNKITYLYHDAKIKYGDIELNAERITIDYGNNLITAVGVEDSTGKMIGTPVFKQGSETYTSNVIKYNFKTKKGIISKVITQQGDGYVHAEKVKRTEKAVYNNNAQYTTCNLAHPHFYISAKKIKMIPDDKMVAGPFHLVIADVPTPLGFILGIFPLPKKQKSGLIFPTYGENANGFNLTNGGYYFRIKDYMGVSLTGDAYTKGTYAGHLNTNYIKRYAFTGSFRFDYFYVKSLVEQGAKTKSFRVVWSHSTQRKGNSSLSANVNLNSSKNFKQITYNTANNLSSNFASTINYRKTFGGSPFNLNVSVRHDQNVQTRVNNLTLPEVAFTMNRIYPFKRKDGTGKNWYEKISVSYSQNAKFFVTTAYRTDSAGVTLGQDSGYSISRVGPAFNYYPNGKQLDLNTNIQRILNGDTVDAPNNNHRLQILRGAQYGMHHTIPISTSIKFLKYFSLNPTVVFDDFMYPQEKRYDTSKGKIIETLNKSKSFHNAFQISTGGTSLTTNIYGMYNIKSKKIVAIRHRMVPSIGYNFRPDPYKLDRESFVRVINGKDQKVKPIEQHLSKYAGSIYGAPSSGWISAVSFSLNNNFEAKVRTPKDTVNATKKISLLDNLGFGGSYNFLADSFKLSNIFLNARTRLFQKIDINYSSSFDPYRYVRINRGQNIDTYVRRDTIELLSLFNHMQTANLSIGTNFTPPKAKRKNIKENEKKAVPNPIGYNQSAYVDFNIPWSLNVNYIASYSKNLTQRYTPLGKEDFIIHNPNSSFPGLSQSISFNGDLSLSEKWKIGFQSGYNINLKKVPFYSFNIFRDLHCWQMSINVINNPYSGTTYMFNIAAKAAMLQDLKLAKRSQGMISPGSGF